MVEAIGLTLSEAIGPGTLCHVERVASEVLRTLRAGDAQWHEWRADIRRVRGL